MGSYNTAVITTVGQALLTSVLGAQGTMTFTKLQTSSYAYASGKDLSALTSLNNVEQEANVGSATIVDSTHIAADATISNSGISTEYNANTLGIFASDGVNEVLFAVSTAVTPDVIPVDSGGTPSTYKYNFTLAVSSTSDITISAVGNIDASDVAYDNSVSGLLATNVQAAIDEIVSSVKRAGKITPSSVSVELTNETPTATVSFTTNSDGVASVASSDPTIATASLSGTVVTITGLKSGTPTVTISIPETEHFTACSATISVDSNIIVIGETYVLGNSKWTAAEDLGNNTICLQSQGMTAGTWPGYKLATDYTGTKSYGSADTAYNGNIDGDNIANYDSITQAWYTKYSAVEKTGQAYGSGLFLVSNAKCGTTTAGAQGSGNYWSALKTAATNHDSFGATGGSWIGNYGGSGGGWYVVQNGLVGYDTQSQIYVIAPAFNLDLTKVKLRGVIIIPNSETDVPTGSTVTPTNSIETWLRCAGIFDKPYTTLAEVLADSSTLATLISSQNAVDYMVRSTSWATDVCANSTAMSLIGLNNYCSNTLLADSTWLNAIANSTYIESVMNVKVPTMTTNTTPSGEAFGTSILAASSDYYKAFDGDDSTSWHSGAINGTYPIPCDIGYNFGKAVLVKTINYIPRVYTGVSPNVPYVKSYQIQGSNDKSTWTTLYTKTNDTSVTAQTIELDNNVSYRYYQMHITASDVDNNSVSLLELQFYGREDV